MVRPRLRLVRNRAFELHCMLGESLSGCTLISCVHCFSHVDNTTGIATGNDPESIYAVMSGTHFNDGCCFDVRTSKTTSLVACRIHECIVRPRSLRAACEFCCQWSCLCFIRCDSTAILR